MTPTYERGVFLIGLLLTAIGAGMALWAGFASKELTGEWLGYPLPNAIAATGGIGLLTFVIGVMFLAAYGVMWVADRPRVRRILGSRVVGDDHFIARAGRTVLRAHRAWDVTVGSILLVLVVVVAFQSRLTAIILLGTVLAVAVV
jgi:hypothetical protein